MMMMGGASQIYMYMESNRRLLISAPGLVAIEDICIYKESVHR